MTTQTNTQANITPEHADAAPAAVAAPESANDNVADVATEMAARGQVPPPEAATDDAARAPVTGPEERMISPTPEGIVPPPHGKLPTPTQAVGKAEHQHEVHLTDNEVAELNDTPFALQKAAEKKLAYFLHQHLSPILSNGLLVDVQSNLDGWPLGNAPVKMDLHIDVMGAEVHKKAEELWTRTTEELKKHPAFAGLEIGGGYESKGPDNDPHPEQTLANMNKLHMVISGIPVGRFKQLLEALAEVKPAPDAQAPQKPAHADVAPDHQCSGAGCSNCSAPSAEAAAKTDVVPPPQSAAPEMHPAAHAAAAAQANAAHAVGAPPATQVAGVDLQGVTNTNEIAPNKTAVGF